MEIYYVHQIQIKYEAQVISHFQVLKVVLRSKF